MNKRSILFLLCTTLSFFLIHFLFNKEEPTTANPTKPATQVTEKISTEPSDNEVISKTAQFPISSSEKETKEEFYVLENEYQQLVFSTKGGALSEINLPFHSEKNPNSVVNPIDFDREIKKNYPSNDYFPQNPYYIFSDSKNLVSKGTLGGYYPLLRRSTYTENGELQSKLEPRYYAFNILNDDQDLENLTYQVTKFEKDKIEFTATQSYRKIVKTYSFSTDKNAPYCIDLTIRIEGDAKNLWLSTGIPEVELISKNASPVLKYRISRNNNSTVEKISLPDPTSIVSSIQPDWICNSNGFLGIIIDPLTDVKPGFKAEKIAGSLIPTRLSLIDPHYKLYPVENFPGYELSLPLKGGITTFRLFSGPFQDSILKQIDKIYSNSATGYNPDYVGAESYHGWFSFISEPFGNVLFFLIQFFYTITHSWGFSIILLTIALKVMLYPLNAWSIRSNFRMQEVGPKTKALQEKYKKDPKRLQMEIMNLYREHGVNPLGGCFPILIQIPFLFGMFELLKSTFELRGASFIPGWINDLASPDILFTWNYPIPFIGTAFHLLPILSGLLLFVQQRWSLKNLPKDPSKLTDQQKQQKIMTLFVPLISIVFFYQFPSGLNIYFLSSTLLGIAQQSLMKPPTSKKPKEIKKR